VVRFSNVMVRPGDGTTIQLLADMCQGQPYKRVVEESADLVSIQLLGTVPDGNTRLSCHLPMQSSLQQSQPPKLRNGGRLRCAGRVSAQCRIQCAFASQLWMIDRSTRCTLRSVS
jgi:hypothetical protein